MSYSQSIELESAGKAIIREHYPHLERLNIAFVFAEEPRVEKGIAVPGKVYREPARQHAIHGFDFMVVLSQHIWRELDDGMRTAVLDHYVAHIGVNEDDAGNPVMGADGRISAYIRKPDVMEFEEVLRRRGDYNAELRSFLRAFAERVLLEREQRKKEAKAAARDPGPDLLPPQEGEG